jgi:hypothetical protein
VGDCGLAVISEAMCSSLNLSDYVLHGFINYREALFRLVRIKARFMRQREQRFAR